MDAILLKDQIAQLLTQVEDERFLESLSAMLQAYVAASPLIDEEKRALEEGLRDADAGRLTDHEQVKRTLKDRYPQLRFDK